MSINIHGEDYMTVEERLGMFRKMRPDWSIVTTLEYSDAERVVVRAVISDEAGRVISTGLAEEYRKASKINETSAVENCETSAIGRALAFYGLTGGGIASADEIVKAAVTEFSQAADADALKAAYAHWYKTFKGTEAEARINAAKDARKNQLEKAA